MTEETFSRAAAPRPMRAALAERARSSIVAVIAFLTLVDLFATQAILPSLALAYQVTPAAMGFAVNATTIGMAVSSLAVGVLSQRIDRRLGIVVCLAVLAIPTSLLAIAPDLMTFTCLRIAQGLCMAGAFTLTLAYLGERFMAAEAAAAFAAYITGNVASNFIGRLMSAALADHFGIATNFIVFAVLNLSGALVVCLTLECAPQARTAPPRPSDMIRALADHLRNPRLISAFAIGFCILFAFIGAFTYVNFVLARPPIGLGMMAIGFVYFVFLPSMFTTPAAGGFVRRFGSRMTVWGGLAVALAGLPLLIVPRLAPVAAGLVLVGVGTFFAQAAATGFVGRVAISNRGAASGLYLTSYFSGGLVGTAALGQIFDRFGWGACVLAIGFALAVSMVFVTRMSPETAVNSSRCQRTGSRSARTCHRLIWMG